MPEAVDDLLTLAELCERVGMSVRNVRFYTSRGLVPPPIRRGRSGYYSRDHVGRLELVQELQSGWICMHGRHRGVDIWSGRRPGRHSRHDRFLQRTGNDLHLGLRRRHDRDPRRQPVRPLVPFIR